MCPGPVERLPTVCYFGTYRAEYSRNQIMIEGLRRNGIRVIECHEPLWQGIEDRVSVASGGWLKPSFVRRALRAYWRLWRRHRQLGDYDLMVLGYPGQLDVPLARLLTWLRGKPLLLDAFMSLYLIASERGLTARHRLSAKLIYWTEKLAYRLPDRLISDTVQYVQWFQSNFRISADRFRLVPTGADDRVFRPLRQAGREDGLLRVIYYGTFISNHGVEHIVQAARLLADQRAIRFELIGQGPEREKAASLARVYGLSNVEFVDWLDREELVRRVAGADICLGAFGVTPQSLMTVQNKIYEALAMGKALITGDSPVMRATFVHGEHLFLCERANPRALAEAILALKDDVRLRESLAESGYGRFQEAFRVEHIGAQFRGHLGEVLGW